MHIKLTNELDYIIVGASRKESASHSFESGYKNPQVYWTNIYDDSCVA